MDVNVLLGLTLVECRQKEADELIFKTDCGRTFLMHHQQDCCENVVLDDICGELSDLIGAPILMAEEVSNDSHPDNLSEEDKKEYDCESYTWTFYKFATRKGYVTLRWFGSSNGYYSESVDFEEIK